MYRLWLNRKLAFSQFKSEKLFTSLLVSVCSRVFARDICCYNIYYSVQCDTNWLWNALVCESIFEISCYYTIIWSHYRFSLLKDGIMLFCHMRVMAFIEWLTREKCFMMIRILPSIFHIFPSPPWTLTCYILRSRQQHPVLLPTIRWDWHDSLVLIRREKFYNMFTNHDNVNFLPEGQVHFCLNFWSLTAWVQQFFFSLTS